MTRTYSCVHACPNGPGDARPTAHQIVQDESSVALLAGKTVLITGCTSHIGVEIARTLHITGAILYLATRNPEKAKTILADLATSKRVHFLRLDLSSLASVRAFASGFLIKSRELHILIANAGVTATPESLTEDGHEAHIGTNHLGHFLLFNLLKDALLTSSTSIFHSRVILLSSIAHRTAPLNFSSPGRNLDGSYDPWIACAQSRTAAIWAANEIERRYGSEGLHAWSVSPGNVSSEFVSNISEQQQRELFKDSLMWRSLKSPEQGAATTVWAAIARALEGKGGRYLEDCQVASIWERAGGRWAPGYAAWAYDKEREGRLWKMSLDARCLSGLF
ncbi:short-chain dehydrogenase [Bisporella sp. PMI_857]|nr:short-chain dehydrogenase [Bisporella sp. PMI_857]